MYPNAFMNHVVLFAIHLDRKATLAAQFAVKPADVTVVANEARRLADADSRRLAKSWTLDFTITAPKAQAAIHSKFLALCGIIIC